MKAYCHNCATEVRVTFGRCRICHEKIAASRLPRTSLQDVALIAGQIASVLGCATAVIGTFYTTFMSVNNLNERGAVLFLAISFLGGVVGFFYCLAMWFVFDHVRKNK